jgi:hypothetical protein
MSWLKNVKIGCQLGLALSSGTVKPGLTGLCRVLVGAALASLAAGTVAFARAVQTWISATFPIAG